MTPSLEQAPTGVQTTEKPESIYKVQPYNADIAPIVLDLAQTSLGVTTVTPMTAAFWHWKHHASPFGTSYGLYAWDEPKQVAVGARILMRWQFRSGDGENYLAVRAVDTATHPNYQRQGLFSRLTKQAIQELSQADVDFIYNTPNQKSLPGYLKMGWQIVARWPLYLKPLRPGRMAIRRLWPQPEAEILPFVDYFGPDILPWPAFLEEYGEQVPALLVAWESTRPWVGLRTPRTLDYLNWRYGQHPTVHYGVYADTQPSGQLTGFAILRPNVRYGWQEVVLTELVLAQATVDAGVQMLHKLARQVRGDYLIAHFAEQTLERQILRKGGFLRLPRQGMVFTVRPLQPEREAWLRPNRWDLTLGDLEIF